MHRFYMILFLKTLMKMWCYLNLIQKLISWHFLNEKNRALKSKRSQKFFNCLVNQLIIFKLPFIQTIHVHPIWNLDFSGFVPWLVYNFESIKQLCVIKAVTASALNRNVYSKTKTKCTVCFLLSSLKGHPIVGLWPWTRSKGKFKWIKNSV